jgi:hypothetical protein
MKYEGMRISPNPASEVVRVQFTLSKPEPVTLTIFNALGQKVAQVLDEILSAGEYEKLLDISQWSLGQGVYFVRLQTPTLFYTLPIHIMR